MIELILGIFAVWVILLYIAKKWGTNYGLDISGPILMWKTEKGKKTIDKIAKKSFWGYYGGFAIVLCIIAMIFTTVLIVFNVIIAFQIPPQNAPSPRLIVGLPGINPVIPIGYGIFALAVAIMIHEFAHGILSRYGDIKIKSLGLLFLIVPIGAFVEPDDEELNSTSRKKRSKVFASGPSTNILLAVACLLILSLAMAPAITPKTNGVITNSDAYDIDKWSLITEIEGNMVSSKQDLKNNTESFVPGSFYNLTYKRNDVTFNSSFFYGIVILNVVEDFPAYSVLKEGDIIYKITYNNTEFEISNHSEFIDVMNLTKVGERITISYSRNDSLNNFTVFLSDKYDYTKKESDRQKGFLGLSGYGINDIIVETKYIQNLYHPLKGSFLAYFALPFLGLSPLPSELEQLYSPSPEFWSIYNILYWVFWLNFAIGTFNALPAIPLDGGYIFRDGLDYILSRFIRKKDRASALSSQITTMLSFIMLIFLVSILVIPRIREFI